MHKCIKRHDYIKLKAKIQLKNSHLQKTEYTEIGWILRLIHFKWNVVLERWGFTAARLVKASDLPSDLRPFFGDFYVWTVHFPPPQNHQRHERDGGSSVPRPCAFKKRHITSLTSRKPELYGIWSGRKFTHHRPLSSFPFILWHNSRFFFLFLNGEPDTLVDIHIYSWGGEWGGQGGQFNGVINMWGYLETFMPLPPPPSSCRSASGVA